MKQEIMDELEKKIQDNIETRELWLQEAKEALALLPFLDFMPELPEDANRVSCSDTSVAFRFRYDKFLMTEIKNTMTKNGYWVTYEQKEENINDGFSDPYMSFRLVDKELGYDEFNVRITFDDSIPESTCHRKVIGKEMKEVKVYEWSCDEE